MDLSLSISDGKLMSRSVFRPHRAHASSPLDPYSDLFEIFGNNNQLLAITPYSPIQIGCSTMVPTFCARRPVKKGDTAPPLLPRALMKLRLEMCMLFGSSLVNTAVADG